jgi:alkylmercury lyase
MLETDTITVSTITCPACGTAKTETMPTNACQYFYECTGCGTLLRPKQGDCCVFCSYGSVPCPPMQASNGEPLCCQSEVGDVTTDIRHGVRRPRWSVVTKQAARDALLARHRAWASFSQKWKLALPEAEDLSWRAVIELFGRLGRPPSPAEIGDETGLTLDQVRAHLAELQVHDLLGTDHLISEIVYAYPFTSQATEHRVALYGHVLHALCAIDALGVGGMFQTDVAITSSCRFCQTPINISTANAGSAISAVTPAGTVVWYDLAYAEAAATSCCPSVGFFCSDDHLQQWLAARNPPRAGYRLTPAEAIEVGRAIFEPVLATR